ncbi:MAG: hypothetical protein LC106_06885 [Burkholderiales bacterium]|nr:hypothetical protein [Burkholderiales bacterium]
MQYRLKENGRFVCGITVFGMSARAIVQVSQIDMSTGKVLIDFGGGLLDWFSESVITEKFEPVYIAR